MFRKQVPPPLDLEDIDKLKSCEIDSGCFTRSPTTPLESESLNHFNFEFFTHENLSNLEQRNGDLKKKTYTSSQNEDAGDQPTPFHTSFYWFGFTSKGNDSITKSKPNSSDAIRRFATSATNTETHCFHQSKDVESVEKEVQVSIIDGPSLSHSRRVQSTFAEAFRQTQAAGDERVPNACDVVRSISSPPDLILMTQNASSHERRLVNIGLALREMSDRFQQNYRQQLNENNQLYNRPTVRKTYQVYRTIQRLIHWVMTS